MSLEIKYGWVDFAGDDLEPIKLTFADLSIRAKDCVITRVLDRRARTTRDSIVTPLFPLAEWAVANWWPLLHESQVPSRGMADGQYLDRHSLRRAREGYSLPDLRVYPEDSWTRLEWRPWTTSFQTVDFLTEGEHRVRTGSIIEALSDLIDSVIGRLQAHGVRDTWLEEEWKVIQATADEEAAFCISAARLGLNPYETDPSTDELIIRACNDLPEYLWKDVLSASPVSELTRSVDWVKRGIKATERPHGVDDAWRKLRARVQQPAADELPWLQGYHLAQQVRQAAGIGDVVTLDLAALVGERPQVVLADPPPTATLDGLVNVEQDVPCLFTAKRRPESQRFLLARGVYSFLFQSACPAAVLTSAAMQDQQCGRAFAAELLAPASILKSRISGDEVGSSEIEDLAAEFQISPLVVGYQIGNHQLARIPA